MNPDLDLDPSSQPEDQGISDPGDFILAQRKRAMANALTSLDDSPEDAARAQELSEATGASPALVYGNLENFEQQHKAALTAHLLKNNQFLAEYADSHPLAAKVSSDDWGQLDTVSNLVQKLHQGPLGAPSTAMSAAVKGFQEGFGQEPMGQWLPTDPEMNRLAWAEMTAIGYPLEFAGRVFSGLMEGLRQGSTQAQIAFGSDANQAEQRSNELAGMVEAQMMTMTGYHPPEVIEPLVRKVGQAGQAVKPYLDAGVEPPVGVHEVIDQLHSEQAKQDVKQLDEIFKESQASATRERAPELFADFIRQHTDARIGIDAEAVRKLYSDKLPEADDNVLGWVPKIQDQLALAEAHGGDVEVPLADWLAKADPEVAKELHDFIRVRPGGMTLEETKEAGKPVELDKDGFNNWFEGSQVVNEANEPLRAFHGTTKDFEEFNTQPEARKNPNNLGQLGSWFAAESKNKVNYDEGNAEYVAGSFTEGKYPDYKEGARITPAYLSIKKPMEFEDYEELQDVVKESGGAKALRAKLEAEGHDGIVVRESDTDGSVTRDDWVAFYPQQIRSSLTTPIETLRKSAGLEPIFAAGGAREGKAEPGIIPVNAAPYEGEPKEVKGGTQLSPYLNFPLKDALKQVNPDYLTGIPAVLHEFYKDRLSKLAGDVTVHVAKDADMFRASNELFGKQGGEYSPAFYNPSTDEIYISDKYASGQMGHDAAAFVLMHEGGHALSVIAMQEHPELRTQVVAMMNEVKQYLKTEEPDLLKEGEHAYAFKNEKEFWAQAWSATGFQHTLSMIPMSEELAAQIGMKSAGGKSIYDAFRRIIRTMMQKLFPGVDIPPTIVDGLFHLQSKFEQIEAKERGKKLGINEVEGAQPVKGEDTERDLFTKANAIGMTKDQYSRYMDLISKRAAEDLAHQVEQGKAIERERQTKEWKDNFARVRDEVRADVRNRPDLAADRLLREGDLHGQKVRHPQLDGDALSPEQKAALPKDYYRSGGVSPDAVANLFGYQSGDALVAGLARLKQERELEGLTPAAHLSKVVDAETERQMRKQYGNLEENILAEAKDHVISQTQLDLLHEETLALGQQSGASLPMSKDDFKRGAKELFNDSPLGSHSTNKYLATAGRAGAKAEQALLEGKPSDAFKAKQQQYISLLLANEAKKLEKERGSFEKLAKQFSKREVGSVPAEYTNWIHDILMRTGNVVRRSVQDLQDAIGRETHDTLEKFVTDKNTNSSIWEQDDNAPSDFQVMPVAPFLFNKDYRTTLDAMTPGEFRAVNNSIKTLVKNGREDQKILVGGEKRDLAETLEKMTSQIGSLFEGKEKQYAFGHKDQGVGHALRTYWASLLQIESIFNRFDRGDPKGVFRKVVSQPIFEGSHELHTLETKYSRLYKTLDFPDKGEMKKLVDNPLFGDPLYDGEKRPLTKGNLLAILQNVGNPSQLDKLARGYLARGEDGKYSKEDLAQFKNRIMEFLFRNTEKKDWDRAQALGNIFEQAFEESAQMYHSLSGVAPEKIDIRPIQTPYGEYRGWYHPIIYDPLRPGSSKKLMGQNPLEDGSYYRVATPSSYTKARTGYAAPIQLSFDAIPFRLKSMLNDIAMRPAVTDAAKVFYDPKFQMTVTKFYSKEIKDLLLPYLKDIAGQKQYKDAAQSTAQRYLEYARQNVTAALIGLNPSTVMKHGPTAAMLSVKEVGGKKFGAEFGRALASGAAYGGARLAKVLFSEINPRHFAEEVNALLSMNDDLGEKNWSFAMKGGLVDGEQWNGSEELQRRQRNWQETLSGAQADLFGDNTLRNTVIKLGATPVAISDLLSAVPTWLASYKAQIRAGEAHGDAVQFADTAVRRAHGSSAVAARPRIMRGGALAQFATPFYTFFNEMFQRQYEMAWRAKDAIEGRSLEQERSGEYKAGLKEVPNLMKGLWAFVVFPALVEQLVSPVLTGQEPTAVKLGAWGMRTVMSSLPGFRDLAEAFIGGRDPTVGLYSTAAKMLTDTFKDISKGEVSFSKAHAGKTIKHTITAFGAVTGLTNAQEGRTGEFVYDYATGKQRPKDIGELLKGLWHGTIKEQRR